MTEVRPFVVPDGGDRMAPYLERTVDHGGEHRARVKGGNHEPLMAITEGIVDKRDVDHALVLTAEAILLDEQLADDLEPAVLAYLERRMSGVESAGG